MIRKSMGRMVPLLCFGLLAGLPGCGDDTGPQADLFINYTTANGLVDEKTLCLTVGPDNSVYSGSYSGLSHFDGTSWRHLRGADGLPGDVVVAVAVSDSGGIWVSGFDLNDANQGSIGYYWEDEWEVFGLFRELIYSIVFDELDGVVWFFSAGGVAWFDNGAWGRSGSNFFGLPCSDIRIAGADGFSNFWLGSRDGVYRYDGTAMRHYTVSDGLPSNLVTAIAEGGPNELWVGTESGPALYHDSAWTSFADIGLSQKLVTAIAVDSEKGIWVGTTTGVSRYRSKKWTPYTSANGLVNERVTAIAGDRLGNVWIGTQGGISRFVLP